MKTPIEIISGMTATPEYSPEAIKQLMARLKHFILNRRKMCLF